MRIFLAGLAVAATLDATAAMAGCAPGEDLILSLPVEDFAELVARTRQAPFPAGLFWRAEGGGLTLDLIGTLHLDDPRLPYLVTIARPMVEAADIVFLEATREGMAEVQHLIATRPDLAFTLEGPTLRQLLTPEEWQVYAAEMAARSVPAFIASQFQPWLAFSTLSLPACLMAAGESAAHGLDYRIEQLAREADVPAIGLEGPTMLFDVFQELGPDFALDLLRTTLVQAVAAEDVLTTTTNAYFAGEHRMIWEFTRSFIPEGFDDIFDADEMSATLDRLEEVLLVGRNQDWMAILSDLPPGTRAVVAVGAAHLSGPGGMLDLLDRAGFALERLDG